MGWLSLALALALFQPWKPDPLPIRDFAGTVNMLSATTGTRDAYQALMNIYEREGRYQPVFMTGFAVQWVAFGTSTVGWQLLRFGLMVVVLVLSALFAVRCGASWVAAAIAMGLWLVVSGGSEAWFLLQVAEPMGALFIVIAGLLATTWFTSRHSYILAVPIALALLMAALSKETMIVAVPFVLLVALCRHASGWGLPELSRRAAVLIGVVGSAVILGALLPILATRASAATTAYASRFALGGMGLAEVSNAIRAITLPVTRAWWFPANVLYVAVLVLGWVIIARRNARSAAIGALVLMVFPLAGAMLYAAWPAFPGYYAMPFAISMGTMLALALTALSAVSRRGRLASYGAVAVVAMYGLVLTWNGARADRAIRRADLAAARLVTRVPADARVLVGVPDPARSGDVASGLLMYGRMLSDGPLPREAEDVTCADAETARSTAVASAVVLFSHLCGHRTDGPPPVAREAVHYLEIDWKTFTPRQAEISVALWNGGRPGR